MAPLRIGACPVGLLGVDPCAIMDPRAASPAFATKRARAESICTQLCSHGKGNDEVGSGYPFLAISAMRNRSRRQGHAITLGHRERYLITLAIAAHDHSPAVCSDRRTSRHYHRYPDIWMRPFCSLTDTGTSGRRPSGTRILTVLLDANCSCCSLTLPALSWLGAERRPLRSLSIGGVRVQRDVNI